MSHSRLEKTLRFTERMVDMVEEIKQARGYATFTSVIYTAVAELHGKTFPAYKQQTKRTIQSPEEREANLAARKRVKTDLLVAEQQRLCILLGGKTTSKGGTLVCNFFNYVNKKRYPQEVSLNQLSEDLVRNQYQPSREKVEKLQQENKVDY